MYHGFRYASFKFLSKDLKQYCHMKAESQNSGSKDGEGEEEKEEELSDSNLPTGSNIRSQAPK
jgi:hypothetical protein